MPRDTNDPPPMKLGGLDEDGDEVVRIKRMTAQAGRAVAGERCDVSTLQHRNGTRQKPRKRRVDGEPMRMTSVHLPIALLRQVNVICAETDRSFSAVAEEALGAFVEARRAG